MLNTSEPEEQAASWQFMAYMLDPANAKTWLFSGGYLPVVKAVNDDPEVQAFWTDDLAGVLLFPATGCRHPLHALRRPGHGHRVAPTLRGLIPGDPYRLVNPGRDAPGSVHARVT